MSQGNDVHISALSFFDQLKRDILLPNGSVNIAGLMYILAIPITLIGIITYIQTAEIAMKNPLKFHIHDLIFTILMTGLMLCKIPYFSDKPIALMQFIIFALLWGIAMVILSIAFNEQIKK
jgi:hypothetical protein